MKQLPIIFCVGAIIFSITPCALARNESPSTAACALHEPDAPRSKGFGTVIGFQDPTEARASIPRREAVRGGAIDPRYLNDPRALVRQDDGHFDTFDVPAGTRVKAGDRVQLQDSFRSRASACSYIPILIVPKDAPIA